MTEESIEYKSDEISIYRYSEVLDVSKMSGLECTWSCDVINYRNYNSDILRFSWKFDWDELKKTGINRLSGYIIVNPKDSDDDDDSKCDDNDDHYERIYIELNENNQIIEYDIDTHLKYPHYRAAFKYHLTPNYDTIGEAKNDRISVIEEENVDFMEKIPISSKMTDMLYDDSTESNQIIEKVVDTYESCENEEVPLVSNYVQTGSSNNEGYYGVDEYSNDLMINHNLYSQYPYHSSTEMASNSENYQFGDGYLDEYYSEGGYNDWNFDFMEPHIERIDLEYSSEDLVVQGSRSDVDFNKPNHVIEKVIDTYESVEDDQVHVNEKYFHDYYSDDWCQFTEDEYEFYPRYPYQSSNEEFSPFYHFSPGPNIENDQIHVNDGYYQAASCSNDFMESNEFTGQHSVDMLYSEYQASEQMGGASSNVDYQVGDGYSYGLMVPTTSGSHYSSSEEADKVSNSESAPTVKDDQFQVNKDHLRADSYHTSSEETSYSEQNDEIPVVYEDKSQDHYQVNDGYSNADGLIEPNQVTDDVINTSTSESEYSSKTEVDDCSDSSSQLKNTVPKNYSSDSDKDELDVRSNELTENDALEESENSYHTSNEEAVAVPTTAKDDDSDDFYPDSYHTSNEVEIASVKNSEQNDVIPVVNEDKCQDYSNDYYPDGSMKPTDDVINTSTSSESEYHFSSSNDEAVTDQVPTTANDDQFRVHKDYCQVNDGSRYSKNYYPARLMKPSEFTDDVINIYASEGSESEYSYHTSNYERNKCVPKKNQFRVIKDYGYWKYYSNDDVINKYSSESESEYQVDRYSDYSSELRNTVPKNRIHVNNGYPSDFYPDDVINIYAPNSEYSSKFEYSRELRNRIHVNNGYPRKDYYSGRQESEPINIYDDPEDHLTNFYDPIEENCIYSLPNERVNGYYRNQNIHVNNNYYQDGSNYSNVYYSDGFNEKKFDEIEASVQNDAILMVDRKRIYVNKQFLAYHSEYFLDLFSSNCVDKPMNEIPIEDVSYNAFKLLLDTISPKPVFPTDKTVEKLLELATRFKMSSVIAQVEHHLLNHSKIGNKKMIWIGKKYGMKKVLSKAIREMNAIKKAEKKNFRNTSFQRMRY